MSDHEPGATSAEPTGAPPEASPPQQTPSESPGGIAWLFRHQSGIVIVIALVAAMLIGAVLIRFQGVNPWYAYETLVKEAILVDGGLTRTLQKTAPLVLTGLAVVLPLRVSLFNIGGQGQFIFGAMIGAWIGYAAGGLGFGGALLGMVAGATAGMLVGSIAGLLKATRGVHEVITTIMLNYIVAGVTWWMVLFPLAAESSKTSGIPQTELIPESARVGAIFGIPIGFIIAVIAAIACGWMLSRSTLGFRFNAVGANKNAAAYAGISINKIIVMSMVLGGGLAGLAGALEAEGTLHRFEPAIGGTLGFDGITIALLARSRPLATIPAAFLVAMLRAGAPGLQFATGIAPEIVDLLLAITLLMVSIPVLGKWIFRSRADKVSAQATSWGE